MAPRSRGGVLTGHRPSEWLLPCRPAVAPSGGRRRALVRSFVVAGGARHRRTGVVGSVLGGSGPRPECRVRRCCPDRGDARDAAYRVYGGPGEAASSRMRSAVSAGCVPNASGEGRSRVCRRQAVGRGEEHRGAVSVASAAATGPSTSPARTPPVGQRRRSRCDSVYWRDVSRRRHSSLVRTVRRDLCTAGALRAVRPVGARSGVAGCALVLGDIASLRENWDERGALRRA